MRKYEDQINKQQGVRVGYYGGSGTQTLEQIIANICRIEETYGKKKWLSPKEAADWINQDFPIQVTKEDIVKAAERSWGHIIYIRENRVYANRGQHE